jgi:hypothetical protein
LPASIRGVCLSIEFDFAVYLMPGKWASPAVSGIDAMGDRDNSAGNSGRLGRAPSPVVLIYPDASARRRRKG